MATGSRTLAVSAAALAFVAPAYAANGAAPGALKQQTAAPDQAAPAPAPVAPAPAAPQAAPKARTPAAPVIRTTGKAVAQTPTTAAPALRSTSATPAARRSTVRRHVASSTPAAQSRPRHRAIARGRPHAARVRALGSGGAPGQRVAAGSPSTAPGQSRSASAAQRASAAAAARAKAKAKANKTVAAPLAKISQAADRVVQVIPGAVILALAGMATLVILLILRSLAVERQRRKALVTSYGVTVEALATAVEAKDMTTGGHIERVRRLGLLLAGEIAPRDVRDPQMAYGFLLHDIGKLAVPDEILRAPGRLTDEQWVLMRRHPEEGVRMLSTVPFLDRALDVVRHHHERWDGGGYPDGLRGEEIPLWARMFSVVDALDAMTAERPYRAPRTYAAALEEIRSHVGTQFDPAVVAALERLDPALVKPLLEPTQQVEPLAELPSVGPLVPA